MQQNLDRFKFRVFYQEAILDVFSFCEEYVQVYNLDTCNTVGKINKKDCILMQSTGLYDKNGKLIYEGDILQSIFENDQTMYGKAMYMIIKYKNGKLGCGYNYNIKTKEYDSVGSISEASMLEHTILGNEFENPALIQH